MRRKRESIKEDVLFENDSQSDKESIQEETVEEKKLKIAREYINTLRDELGDDEENLKLHLHTKEETQMDRELADRLEIPEDRLLTSHAFYPSSKSPLTSLAVNSNATSIYAVDKNGGIAVYDTETGQKTKFQFQRDFSTMVQGNKAPWVSRTGSYGISKRGLVTCTLSSDEKFLVVAGGDKQIHILDPKSKEIIKSLSGHQEAVSGVTFQKGTHKLFSCGYDRTIKIWNLDTLSFEDTLYGHQSEVFDIDMMHLEKLVTVGNDRSCRIWKTQTDSQLVFRAPTLSMECCRMINGTHFISGSADGLQLWSITRKKPICCITSPHDLCSVSCHESCWVQSLATIHNTDLIASGASDGSIRLWQAKSSSNRMNSLVRKGLGLEAKGFITSLHLALDGSLVIGSQSREPRLGSWSTAPTDIRNGIIIHKLNHD